VYSSLTKIDIVTDGPEYIQTDHRSRDEIEATPELSVLFALARVCNARRYNAASQPTVVYVVNDAPPFLEEAVAAAGGLLERKDDRTRRTPAPASATAAELADRAYRGLAERVQRRLGAADSTAALRALEAELAASRPTLEDDEVGYWTCVCELSALAGEIMRAAHPGAWVASEHPDIPFGFSRGDAGVAMPTNRAQRFLADGEGESMFHLLASEADLRTRPAGGGPLLPSLRARADAAAMGMVFRPLFDHPADLVDVPVIGYGHDTPTSFSFTRATGREDVAALHAEALRNLATQDATVESFAVDGATVLVVGNSFYAAEKLLDVAFLRSLHERLGTRIAVAVPKRGLLYATAVDNVAILRAIAASEASGSRSISSAVLLVNDGVVVDVARVEDDPAPRKRGWLRRLLSRN